ncbi:MAG: metal-dependent hydrolase [Rhodospirillaceae bacterium]|nr:metal-dependent hydrolase [Rhodospirillaceae bacterium]
MKNDASMQIVDAQIHLWSSGLPSNLSHRQVTSFSSEEAIKMMDESGVDAAVIHLVHWDPNCHQVALDAVKKYPRRFAMLGELPLTDPAAKDLIANLTDQPNMLGLRYVLLNDPERKWMREGKIDWLWPAAEAAGVPVTVLATDSIDLIHVIAERHPGLRLTIDHLGGRGGLTTLKDHAAMVHIPDLLALAKYPNIAVKVTGAPGYSSEAYPFPIMQTYVHKIYDAFGPERTFWGTDITKMPCSWRDCITMFTEELPWLNEDDKRLIMGDAVCKWWGWKRDY